MSAVCFRWFRLGNLRAVVQQSGGFPIESSTCRTDQRNYVYLLVFVVAALAGRINPTLLQHRLQAFFDPLATLLFGTRI